MKYLLFSAVLSLASLSIAVHAEEYGEAGTEKVEAKMHDAKRSTQKSLNRAEEQACAEGTMNCTGKKIKNRAGEAKDYVKDKSKQIKNKVD